MRTPNLGTVQYVPRHPPSDPAELQRYLAEELPNIAAAIMALSLGHLDKTTVAPTKPRDGDIRYADGVSWLPNGTGGVGIYYFDGVTWKLLG
jgi:hypothetical protein